ncbi:DUF6155 family protein [Flavobacterium sp. '19STA2R22 D10 B1']|uniref:DUF6155 family protein n=1 Tax=Flavobacterium aerium TaxID=3037261 RepID=UPI00278BD352|nr:DUF6155 family protein [Flavobacterium sp. '19STA2R22 D10 B1']
MSKRDLKKYLAELNKEQLEEQLIDLYDKFSDVKVFYDFVFNPKEEKLIQEAKTKISNEYFPIKGRKPKMRRSTAQKFIKHFMTLGVDPYYLGDLMFYNIEIAQRFSAKREMKYTSFYKSIFNSFEQAVEFCIANGVLIEFKNRIQAIEKEVNLQKWENKYEFQSRIEKIDF